MMLCIMRRMFSWSKDPCSIPGIAFLQAGEEMGYDIRDPNGEQQTGFALYQFTMRRGYRCSTAKAFLNPIRLRSNLHTALWTHVTRVLIDPETRRAYGVEFVREGVKRTVLARREVILSAGAINTPQLLMLSGKSTYLLIPSTRQPFILFI